MRIVLQKRTTMRQIFLKIETKLQKIASMRQKSGTLRQFLIVKKISKILEQPCDNFVGCAGLEKIIFFFKKNLNKACDIFLSFRFFMQPYNILGHKRVYLGSSHNQELATGGKIFCSWLFFDLQNRVLIEKLATFLLKSKNLSHGLQLTLLGGW